MPGKMPARVLLRVATWRTLALLTTGTLTDHRLGASVAVVADYEGANLPFDFLADLLVDENFRVVRAALVPVGAV